MTDEVRSKGMKEKVRTSSSVKKTKKICGKRRKEWTERIIESHSEGMGNSQEAEQTVEDCQNAINELLEVEVASLTEAEEIIEDYLGLEPDYLMAFLNY